MATVDNQQAEQKWRDEQRKLVSKPRIMPSPRFGDKPMLLRTDVSYRFQFQAADPNTLHAEYIDVDFDDKGRLRLRGSAGLRFEETAGNAAFLGLRS